MTIAGIAHEYDVGREDVLAALSYAADMIDAELFHPLSVPAV